MIHRRQRHWRDRLWSLIAKAYDYPLLQRLVYRPTQQTLLRNLATQNVFRILDVGCGTGEFTLALANMFVEAEITGLDMAQGMIEEAQTKVANAGHRLHFAVADAQQLTCSSTCYDLVTCTNSLIFYAHPKQALREMHRVLVPGAELGLVNLVMPAWARTLHLPITGIHLPTLREMENWCDDTGFRIKASGYVHPKMAWIFPFGYLVCTRLVEADLNDPMPLSDIKKCPGEVGRQGITAENISRCMIRPRAQKWEFR